VDIVFLTLYRLIGGISATYLRQSACAARHAAYRTRFTSTLLHLRRASLPRAAHATALYACLTRYLSPHLGARVLPHRAPALRAAALRAYGLLASSVRAYACVRWARLDSNNGRAASIWQM
jgi:hypothetical protein